MYATGHVELVLIIKSLVLQTGIAALSLTKDVYFQQTTAAAVGKLMILMCKSNLLFPVLSEEVTKMNPLKTTLCSKRV